MNFIRNTIAVLVGLAVAALIISLGVRLNSSWITYDEYAPFGHWEQLLQAMKNKPYFYVALLISSGIAATVGGVIAKNVAEGSEMARIGVVDNYIVIEVNGKPVNSQKDVEKILQGYSGNVQVKYVDEYGRITTRGFKMP